MDHPDQILTEEDYETPRTPTELRAWWNAIFAQFNPSKKGRRVRTKLTKKFYEEALVVSLYVSAFHSESPIRCFLHSGTGADDACLRTGDDSILETIQVTFAKDGWADELRSRKSKEVGWVNGTALPFISVVDGKRMIEIPQHEGRTHRERIDDSVRMLKFLISKKANRSDLSTITLLVGFDDSTFDPTDRRFFQDALGQLKSQFQRLVVIGFTSRIIFEVR